MTEELKPCPFCGNDQLMVSTSDIDGCTAIFCPQCDSSGPSVFASEADAKVAWNTRA